MIQQDLANSLTLGFPVNGKAPATINVLGANPAANTELSDTVPANTTWVLLGYAVTLVQGITQTPTPNLVITDGTNEVISFPGSSAAVSVSTTTRLCWVPGVTLTAGAGATRNYSPIPIGLILPAGWKITTVTTGIGANTDYGAPSIYVKAYS